MNDTQTTLRALRKRGYTTTRRQGCGHWIIAWHGTVVATASHSPHGGSRAVENLRAQVRRFERNLQT